MSDAPTGPNSYQATDGKWYSPVPPPPATKTSGLAIASMVLGIVWVYWIGSILAVIFGHVALNKMSKDPSIKGRGFAIAGISLGWTGVGFLTLVIIGIMIG
jgi:hypothetical protein